MINDLSQIPCMILCGGKGTRLKDVTEILPKPMVSIGDFPIVVHIMNWYASFGVKKFILCLGYKKEKFIDYFINFSKYSNDISIDLKTNQIKLLTNNINECEIILCDTGLESKTGKRMKTASKYVYAPQFFLTYGDGLSDIDINKLFHEHIASQKRMTLTRVKNPARFGLIEVDGTGNILNFREKNHSDGYINGGFMVIDQEFIKEYMDDSDVFFEKEPIDKAIAMNDVHAYTHNGFWQCMDNLKEYEYLNDLWKSGNAPWKAL